MNDSGDAKQTQPNILFLFPDQWRWDWLGCEQSPYGKVPVRTPYIDRLAQSGVRFTQCRTNSPLCAPARAALVTGKRVHRCGVPNNSADLDPRQTNFMQLLRAEGYRVAVTGKPDLRKHGQWKGLDGWTQRIGKLGFTESSHQAGKWDAVTSGAERPRDAYTAHLHRHGLAKVHVEDYQRRRDMRSSKATTPIIDPSPTPLPREHYTDDFCGRSAESFLKRWAVGEPWFLWVNFPGPHEPFDPPTELLKRYEGVEFPPPISPDARQAHDHQALRRCYAAMIEGIDEWVGRLIDVVEERGERDNTIIVFSSDHGEMLGDRGCWYKSVPYEGSIHVPLIIAGPGVGDGVVSDALVELIDLSATMLDFADLALPDDCDARSVRPVLSGERDSHRDVQVSELQRWRAIIDGQYKLIEHDEIEPRLFDVRSDPAESHNLIKDRPDIAAALSDRLARERGLDKCINPERPESSGVH